MYICMNMRTDRIRDRARGPEVRKNACKDRPNITTIIDVIIVLLLS